MSPVTLLVNPNASSARKERSALGVAPAHEQELRRERPGRCQGFIPPDVGTADGGRRQTRCHGFQQGRFAASVLADKEGYRAR